MDVSNMLTNTEFQTVSNEVDSFNKSLPAASRNASRNLGKDDFLKILLTQLQNQDPTAPVEDREFIAQMAQFSTLEQMTEMSNSFKTLSSSFSINHALGLLGRPVEVEHGGSIVAGTVQAVQSDPNPQVMIDGTFYDLSQVHAVYER